MDASDDLLDYARLLDQARMMDPVLLAERAGWRGHVIRDAIDRNLSAFFFSEGGRITRGRCPAVAQALGAALATVSGVPSTPQRDQSAGREPLTLRGEMRQDPPAPNFERRSPAMGSRQSL